MERILWNKLLRLNVTCTMKTHKLLAPVFALVISSLPLVAQSKPNFSGTWELNTEKSDLGGAPISKLTVQVEHKDPVLKYTATGNAGGEDFSESQTISTDGKPTTDSRGAQVKAHWQGATLIIESTGPEAGASDSSRLTLSADGKTMTRDDDRTGNEGPQKRHELYNKK